MKIENITVVAEIAFIWILVCMFFGTYLGSLMVIGGLLLSLK
jgi:hypothetical protein